MYLALSLAAALCYSVGGIFMKLSDGLSRPTPSALVFVCFMVGAGLQALAMREAELGVAYVFVLGLEAVLAVAFGMALFGERASPIKLAGVAIIIVGMALLHVGPTTRPDERAQTPQSLEEGGR